MVGYDNTELGADTSFLYASEFPFLFKKWRILTLDEL